MTSPPLLEFLGAEVVPSGLRAEISRDLYGAYEAASGGVVAALAVAGARRRAEGRRPLALDCQFVQRARVGVVHVETTLRREGRALSVVEVEVTDGNGVLAALATATFIDPAALRSIDDAGMVRPGASVEYAEASPFQLRRPNVPIVGTLSPRVALTAADLVATVLEVPWDEPGTAAEAACLAADMAVGPAVTRDLEGTDTPHPNPDLSLRFAGLDAGSEVAGVARLERIAGGVALVRIEVFSGIELLAVGCSTAVLLDGIAGDAETSAAESSDSEPVAGAHDALPPPPSS